MELGGGGEVGGEVEVHRVRVCDGCCTFGDFIVVLAVLIIIISIVFSRCMGHSKRSSGTPAEGLPGRWRGCKASGGDPRIGVGGNGMSRPPRRSPAVRYGGRGDA